MSNLNWGSGLANETLVAGLACFKEMQLYSSPVKMILSSALLFGTWRIYVVFRGRQVYGQPDITTLFRPMSLFGMIFGMGITWNWEDRETAYSNGKETIRMTPWIWGDTILYTRSLDILRQVAGGGSNRIWVKPDWASGALMLFGRNLISENLESWRRHRRVMQPAFNAKTYDLVWTETTKIYQDMVKTENWPTSPGERVSLESFNKLTYKLGLYVIIACGFGLPFRWAEPPKSTEGSKSVQDNIVTVEKWALLLIMTPKWLFKLPFKKLQNIYEEYESIKSFIREEVAIRRSKIREAVDMGEVDREAAVQFDVFSRLVLANETADSKSGLSDEELIGNTFALLFAGHDTTASTVAAVVALLALHPSEQRKVHEEVMNVLREDGALTLSSYSKLTYTLYCFLEASRMFPAGHVAIRTCLEDTVIDIPSTKETDSPTRLVLPKNSEVIVDMVGLHYSPHIFKDPTEFLPSRWKDMNEETFSTFSTGPRACIGKKFALTEALCVLSNLVKDWEIEPCLKSGETLEGWKQRVLDVHVTLTLGIKDVPVTLIRR
ncbi:hypothetical protein FRC14_003845 [Serendipita sp. 396]|nr:hypothetical protein FRC14_003845 [Serendipita sp. 396]KAG8789449.1 hypothetical protein FRC15_008306 [Serendipita sp. 397]KAG8879035.1 hypothetical protein FRC20_003794 [Serendipita sp. 405]